MGFFRTKKKTIISVTSVAQPLLEMKVDPLKAAVIGAITEDKGIVDEIFDLMLNGPASKVKRAYRYARDNYTLGLPQSSMRTTGVSVSTLESLLSGIEGQPVTVVDSDLDSGNEWFFIAHWLYLNRGFNFLTNTITPEPNWKAGLDTAKGNDKQWVNEQVTQIEADLALEFPDYSVTEGVEEEVCEDVCVEWDDSDPPVCTLWEEQCETITNYTTTDTTYSFDTVIDEQHQDSEQLLDTLSTFESGQITGFTVDYQLGSVSLYTATTTITRHDTVEGVTTDTVVEDRVSEFVRYPSAVYTETVSMSPNMVQDHVLVSYMVDNEPKLFLANVESGEWPTLVPIVTVSDAGAFYPIIPLRVENEDYCSEARQTTDLYLTSRKLLDRLDVDILDLAQAVNDNPDIAEIDHAFLLMGVNVMTDNRAGLRYLNEFFHRMGQLGGNEVTIEDSKFKFKVSWSNITSTVKPGVQGYRGKTTRVVGSTYLRWNQQITENSYREVTVYNPLHTNYIYSGHNVVTDLAKAQTEDDNNFYVPLYTEAVNAVPPMERNRLYYAALQMVFNSYKVTIQKIKWYQKSVFRTILTIAAIAIAIYTGYVNFATFASMTAAEIAVAVIQALIISYAFKLAFQAVVRALGVEFAMILAVVAMAFGMYDLAQSGFLLPETMWAENLLMIANGLTTAINDYIQSEIMDIGKDVVAFGKHAKEKLDELERVSEELYGHVHLINPMKFTQMVPFINTNEIPDVYYERTVHNKNPGTNAYSMLSNHVQIALTLPKPPPVLMEGGQGSQEEQGEF